VTDLKNARAALATLNRRLMDAQEQERSRLARELHDDICQRMVFLGWELRELSGMPSGTSRQMKLRLEGLCDYATALNKDIQTISHRLHSSKLEYLGLVSAAGSFCQVVSTQHGLTIEYMHQDVPGTLPSGVELCLYRVLQEAVSNAVKHSNANHYTVTLRGTPEAVELEVIDNGCGFNAEGPLNKNGLGLVSMRERLGLVNGELFIKSESETGTRVCAHVPLVTDLAHFV
jgi:signal transduction histidine kinase